MLNTVGDYELSVTGYYVWYDMGGTKHQVSKLKDVQSFEEAGVLTSDAGFVVRLKDGSEFQVTVVKSR